MTYTKRQISEAIAYWKNQLNEMNETETSSFGDVDNKKRLQDIREFINGGEFSDNEKYDLQRAIDTYENTLDGNYVNSKYAYNASITFEHYANDHRFSDDDRDLFMDVYLTLYKKSGRDMR